MIIKDAQEVLKAEAEGILRLAGRIDENFVKCVEAIYSSTGRVVIGGIGKSGLIGQKIAATLSSTGTRAFFLHPVEAMHGDLGMVGSGDVFLALSNSGETAELNLLVPSMKSLGCMVIALTGNRDSTLARQSDVVVDVGVEREACPMGLTPTVSTTTLLAAGDALAVALINKREFKPGDFKRFHPGGSLGQRLSARAGDLMLKVDSAPTVPQHSDMLTAVREIDKMNLGVVIILKPDRGIAGILTDGDIRRLISEHGEILKLDLKEVMSRTPLTLLLETPVCDALNLMEKHQITVLPITDSRGTVCGLLHLHDILGKGEFKFKMP